MEKTDYIQLFDKFLLKQASAEEIQVLIQWLKSEGSFQDWADEEWNAAASEMDTKLQRQLFGQIKEKISQIDRTCLPEKENRPRRVYLWFARVASVILLLSMTGLSVYYYTMSQMIMPDMIVSVEKGQKANVVLPDGSKVWLNAGSSLKYPENFWPECRLVELTGQGYFEVTKNPEKPFIVKVDPVYSVEVLGTRFDVSAYNDDDVVSTTLVEGSVKLNIAQAGGKIVHQILKPDEKADFTRVGGKLSITSVNADNKVCLLYTSPSPRDA